MMNTLILFIYLASVSEALSEVSGIIAILLGFIAICVYGAYYSLLVDNAPVEKNALQTMRKGGRCALFGACFCVLLYVISPPASTIYAMAGLKAGTALNENTQTNELSQKALKLLNSKLDEMIRNSSSGGGL